MSARNVRLRHAKRLANTRLCKATVLETDIPKREECLASLSQRQRSAMLVSTFGATIYSVMLEQCRSLAARLRMAVSRIVRACSLWCDVRRADEAALLNSAIDEIKLCFGRKGCSTYIGLLDPGALQVTYIAASSESNMKDRTLSFGKGIVFRCITNSVTVVVDSLETAKQTGVHFFGPPLPKLFPLICVPLRAEVGHPVGVLTVDSLASNAIPLEIGVTSDSNHHFDNLVTCEDYHDRLSPFVDKNDELCKRIKLWKLADKIGTNNTRSATCLVCGHVDNVLRLEDIGSIYRICWEDGSCDADVSFRVMKDVLRYTPAVLGVGVPSDSTVLGFIEYAGKVVGEHLMRYTFA